jgi:hypothetical protein
LDGETELPATGTYYVVASNGMFLNKDTGLVRAMVKVEGIAILKSLKPSAELRLPMIPSTIIAQSLLFFRRVYSQHHSEAITLLYYSKEKGEFMVDAPPQETHFAGLKYEPLAKFGDLGFQLVGTIHSHCDFGAFHSGTDINDEKNFDGIHITLGRVDQPYFTNSVTIAVNNNRFKVDAEKAIVGIKKVEYQPTALSKYRRMLGVPRNDLGVFSDDRHNWLDRFIDGADNFFTPVCTDQFYDLILPDGKDYRNFPVSAEWLARVEKIKFKEFGFKDIKDDDVIELLPEKIEQTLNHNSLQIKEEVV